jgi:hypothetical protein
MNENLDKQVKSQLQEDPFPLPTFTEELAERVRKKSVVYSERSHSGNRRLYIAGAGIVAAGLIVLGGLQLVGQNGRDEGSSLSGQNNAISSAEPGMTPPTPVISPNPTTDASLPPNQRYIVYKNAYYVKTDEVLPTSQVGSKVLTVTRIGDWAIKKEGDTNEFPPGPDLYTVKGSDDSKMAVKVRQRKTTSGTVIYQYQIVERYATVVQPESSTILGAKGDYNEVAIAIKNIRKKDPYLFELTEMDSRAKLFSVNYWNQELGGC